MARLRFTLAEAKAEAVRLATEFVTAHFGQDEFEFVSVSQAYAAAFSKASKHPVRWNVTFKPVCIDRSIVIDGGECFVIVDLENKLAKLWTFGDE